MFFDSWPREQYSIASEVTETKAMSHTEAFGHLRSFVVGLEIKARDLRTVLESSRDNDGKWINGKDGTGIGERCARGGHKIGQKYLAERIYLLHGCCYRC